MPDIESSTPLIRETFARFECIGCGRRQTFQYVPIHLLGLQSPCTNFDCDSIATLTEIDTSDT